MVQVLNRGSNVATLSERVQRKNEARRLEILRAAARVFRRLGLSATGMREIAEEADLSPATCITTSAARTRSCFSARSAPSSAFSPR